MRLKLKREDLHEVREDGAIFGDITLQAEKGNLLQVNSSSAQVKWIGGIYYAERKISKFSSLHLKEQVDFVDRLNAAIEA